MCEANPHNITLIFNQLMAFIQEIERALKCQPGTHCTLYAFLMDYIKVNQTDISGAAGLWIRIDLMRIRIRIRIQLQEKPSTLKREHSALQNMKILHFILFLRVIFALLDPDPDPATQINADPDSQPCRTKSVFSFLKISVVDPDQAGPETFGESDPEELYLVPGIGLFLAVSCTERRIRKRRVKSDLGACLSQAI